MAEMDMVERVARRIANEMHAGGDFGMTGEDAYRRRSAEFLALGRAAIEAMQQGMDEREREIERTAKVKLRLAFRKALTQLPEIAPPEVKSVLAMTLMRDEFFNEGKRLQMEHGLDAVPPRVESECGAGAWSFMRSGLLAALSDTSAKG